jgi:hypothetical protein
MTCSRYMMLAAANAPITHVHDRECSRKHRLAVATHTLGELVIMVALPDGAPNPELLEHSNSHVRCAALEKEANDRRRRGHVATPALRVVKGPKASKLVSS